VPPLVSIVTPSLNMAEFLEATIQSVLAQDYSSIEYTILDGGSTDGTRAIAERYKDRITFIAEPDDGPADSIHKGLSRARGEIVSWLSADDLLLPGAVRAAVEAIGKHPKASGVYGDAQWINASGQVIRAYPTRSFDAAELMRECFICQPACFFRKAAYAAAGGVDKQLGYTFDWDLWMRMSKAAPLVHVPDLWAQSRMHSSNLTLGQRGKVLEESIALLRRRAGYVPVPWVYGWMTYQEQPTDQFFDVPARSPWRYVRALRLGLAWNKGQNARYAGEWISGLRAHRPTAN